MAYSWYEPREPSVDRMYRPRPKLVQQLLLDDVDEANCEYRVFDLRVSFYEIFPLRILPADSDESTSEYSEVTGSSSSLASYATTNMTTNMTTCSSASSAAETANVFLRLRPLLEKHNDWEDMCVQSDQVLTINSQAVAQRREMEKTFTFSGIFDSSDHQRTVYQHSVKKLMENDRDTVVLTYGTSGSGKTYTILGTSDNPGIVPRALYNLFGRYRNNIQTTPVAKTEAGKLIFLSDAEILKEEIASREFLQIASQIETNYDVNTMLATMDREEDVVAEHLGKMRVFVYVSFLEIYNERVFDLLAPTPHSGPDFSRMGAGAIDKRKELKVVLNGETTTVKNLRSIFVRSCEDVMRVLNYGMHQVSSGSTQINARSSRSHCIFTVDVITDTPDIGFNFTQYKFGDLAGTERLKKTENVGDRLKEAQHINTSLLALSRCLDVLHANGTKKKKDMVPFRESKLTMLIKAALNGLDNFVMIVNMLPALEFVEENLHVLNFASIAKQLSMKPSVEVMRRQRKQRFSKVSCLSGAGGGGYGPDHDML